MGKKAEEERKSTASAMSKYDDLFDFGSSSDDDGPLVDVDVVHLLEEQKA